jgi:hypothetical protein
MSTVNVNAYYWIYNQTIPFIQENNSFIQVLHGPNANIYYMNDTGMYFVGNPVYINNEGGPPTCRIRFIERFQHLEDQITYIEGWTPIGKCITCNYPHRNPINDESNKKDYITIHNSCHICWLNYNRDEWPGDGPEDFLEPQFGEEDNEDEDNGSQEHHLDAA